MTLGFDDTLGSIYNWNRPPQIAYDLRNQLSLGSGPVPSNPLSSAFYPGPLKSITPTGSLLDQIGTGPMAVTQARGVSPILNFQPSVYPDILGSAGTRMPSTFTGIPMGELAAPSNAAFAGGANGISGFSQALVPMGDRLPVAYQPIENQVAQQLALNAGPQRLALGPGSPLQYSNAGAGFQYSRPYAGTAADPFFDYAGMGGRAAGAGESAAGGAARAAGAAAKGAASPADQALLNAMDEALAVGGATGKAWPGKLGMLKSAEGITPLGKGILAAGVPIAANALLGNTLSQIEAEGGTSGAVAGGLHGGIKGAQIGLPLIMTGNPFAVAGGSAIIGGGAVLGALKGHKGAQKGPSLEDQIDNVAQISGLDPNQTKNLKATAVILKQAGNADADILQSVVLPAVQEQTGQAQAQTQQQQQMDLYRQQLQDYFGAQAQNTALASSLGVAVAAPYLAQMRADAQNRRELVDQVLNQAGGPKFTDAYKNSVRNSQGALANAIDQQATSYAQQLQMAPYLAQNQEQANAYTQLMYQIGQSLQPAILQPSYASQQSQDAQLQSLLAYIQKQQNANTKAMTSGGTGTTTDILNQLAAQGAR